MAARSAVIAAVPIVFIIGVLVAGNNGLAIGAIIICVLAVVIRLRAQPMHFISGSPLNGLRPDWILILVPTVLAMRTFNEKVSLLATGLLVAIALLQRTDTNFRFQPGPLILLLASSAIVFSRPGNTFPLLTFVLMSVLVVRLVTAVDARRLVASLIDGCGLYLAVNFFGFMAGFQSPAAQIRIGGLAESTGFVRTIYPLTTTLNAPPTIAALYIVAFWFLMMERGWLRRTLRLTCFLAAVLVLIGAGSRVPIIVAAGLSIIAICFTGITRWVAQATTIFAALSPAILPGIVSFVYVGIAPLASLAPGRVSDAKSITTLENRDVIWSRSIKYWTEWVNDPAQVLFGFGVDGQYRSGASYTYRDMISLIVRNPELASVHNSFLQQLFDGGIVGLALLIVALYWAGMRLASRRRTWGIWGLSAIFAFTALLLSGITEVSLAPGPAQDTFWLLIVLVGIACQRTTIQPLDIDNQGLDRSHGKSRRSRRLRISA
jgi:hypothetical protein